MQEQRRRRGRLRIPRLTLFLVALLGAEFFAATKIGTAEPVGVWKDEQSEYYIVFDPTTLTYRETTYNIPRPYSVNGDSVVLTDVSGQQTVCQLGRNFGYKVSLSLNGEKHLMSPIQSTPLMSEWGVAPRAEDCVAVYSSKVSFGNPLLLRIYSDRSYVFKNVEQGADIQGKYAVGTQGDLLLFSTGEAMADVLKPWELGYVMGALDTNISAQVLKANAIDNRGLVLCGYVRIPDAGATYDFQEDNIVIRTLSTGEQVKMLYFVDSMGLVTMSDMVGGNSKDYMWYDVATGVMYRYIFERDNWFDFVDKAGALT